MSFRVSIPLMGKDCPCTTFAGADMVRDVATSNADTVICVVAWLGR